MSWWKGKNWCTFKLIGDARGSKGQCKFVEFRSVMSCISSKSVYQEDARLVPKGREPPFLYLNLVQAKAILVRQERARI